LIDRWYSIILNLNATKKNHRTWKMILSKAQITIKYEFFLMCVKTVLLLYVVTLSNESTVNERKNFLKIPKCMRKQDWNLKQSVIALYALSSIHPVSTQVIRSKILTILKLDMSKSIIYQVENCHKYRLT